MPELEGQGTGLNRGNPSQGADSGNEAAGSSFVTGLEGESGSGSHTASQQAAQDDKSTQAKGSEEPTGVLPGYAAALTKELKANEKATAFVGKFKSMDDLVKSAMEADSKLGGMVSIPKDDSSPEELQAFYEKLGVPKTPEEYKLTIQGKTVSESELADFKKTAHELHLNQKQAQIFVDKATKNVEDISAAYRAKMIEGARQTEAAFRQEYGDKYDQFHSTMIRGWKTVASHLGAPAKDFAKELDESGLGNSPNFARMLYQIGLIVQEDSSVSGTQPRGRQADSGIERKGLE